MQRPRIKPEHKPVRYGESRIAIGGRVFGIASEIPDPDGWIWNLLEELDGTRPADQVISRLVRRHPELSPDGVRTAIDDLATAGYLEETHVVPDTRLTERERERYSRSQAYFRWVDRQPRESSWEPQLALRAATVLVIGVGGTGGAAALALAASGVGRMHLVEPDVVELSNLNRQLLYTEADLGRAKVDVALDRLAAANCDIQLTGEKREVTGSFEIAELLPGVDVLVLGGDRPAEIRSWANRACLATGTAWVHGGYHGPEVTAGVYVPGGGPCYDCMRTAEKERKDKRGPATPWGPALAAEPVHAANAITAGMSGNLVAHLALRLITGAPSLPLNGLYGINLAVADHSFFLRQPEPRSDCPACGATR